MQPDDTRPPRQGAPDPNAEREAFTQSILRWQSAAPTYGAPPVAPTTPDEAARRTSPAQALSEIIRAAGADAAPWDDKRLAASARAARTQGRLEGDATFYTQVPIMNLISHAIEERLIAERRACDVYAGFQRLALVRPQLRRYRALAEVTRYLCLYGIDDTAGNPDIHGLSPRSTLRFPIKPELQTGLENFWFVVVDDPRMPTALLAQHTGGDIWSSRQATRSFTGIWTFNPTIVAEIIAILRRAARILYYNTPDA